jgi:PAS domain S-box-containing protein
MDIKYSLREILFDNNKHIILFSLNNENHIISYNEAFQNIIKKKLKYNNIIGLSFFNLINDKEEEIYFKHQIEKCKHLMTPQKFTYKVSTENQWSFEWIPFINENLITGLQFLAFPKIKKLKSGIEKHISRLNFLDRLKRINHIMDHSQNLEEMLKDILHLTFQFFEIEKAYFLNPIDPDAESVKIYMLTKTPTNEMILQNGKEEKVTPFMSSHFKKILNSNTVQFYGYNTKNTFNQDYYKKYGKNTYVVQGLKVNYGKPWLFGIKYNPSIKFTKENVSLFKEISIRLSACISSIILNNDNQKKENEQNVLLNIIPDLILRINKKGLINDFKNAQEENYIGNSQNYINKNLCDLLPPEKYNYILKEINDVLKNNIIKNIDFEIPFDTNNKYFKCRLLKISNKEVLFLARDVTYNKIIQTKLELKEIEYKNLIENLPILIARFNLEKRFIYINSNASKMFGIPTNSFIGKNYIEIATPINQQAHKKLFDVLTNVIKNNKTEIIELERTIKGRKINFEITFIPERKDSGELISVLAISEDITHKREARELIERNNRALRMLSMVNHCLTRINHEQDLIEKVCAIIIDVGGYKLSWVGYLDYGPEKLIIPAAFYGKDGDYIKNSLISWDKNNPRGNGPGGVAARTGIPYVLKNLNKNSNFSPWKNDALKRGFKSIIALPLRIENEILGVIGIYSSEKGIFEKREVELLEEMTNNLAYGIKSIRVQNEKLIAELELKNSEKRYRLITEHLSDYQYSISINNNYKIKIRRSDIFYAITGYFAADMESNNKRWSEIVHPDDVTYVNQYQSDILAGKNIKPIEYRIFSKSGELKWIKDARIPIKGNSGNVEIIEGVIKEITKEKNAESDLKDSEERFSKIFKLIPFSILLIEAENSKIVDVNKEFLSISGYLYSEVIGKKSTDINLFVNPKDRLTLRKSITTTGYVENYEFKFKSKDNRIYDGLNTSIEILFKNKKHFLVIIQNITKRKQSEIELQKLLRAIEQSPVSVLITDSNGIIEYINPKFTAITGYSLKEIIGKTPRILKSDEMPLKFYNDLWATISKGKEWFGEILNKKKNGELFWEYASISPVFNLNGEITNYIAVKEDISEKKNTERKIIKTIISTEEKERTHFSQELHDGLGPIISMIKLYFQWLSETSDPEKKENISKIGMQNIDDAISTLREISNRLSPVVLLKMGFVAALKKQISFINQTNKVNIFFSYDEIIRYDSQIEITIYRVITELLNNTIKYANATEVKIELFHNLQKKINIIYSDNGKGYEMTEELVNKGLGLQNIIRKINSLKGTISFVRNEGEMKVMILLPNY